nr:hypothetical protein BaRGS_032821 [Batillaria attramentaria]
MIDTRDKGRCAPDFIVSMDAQPLVRDGVLNDTHGRRVDPSPTPGNESRGSGAGQGTGPSGKLEYNNEDEREEEPDRFGGLSRTQVVVISTCSAIIALFFLVAGILRVRNYIKRVREEQMLAQRPTFRSCSVRLRSVSQSNDPVRRDSQVSKLSHQSNYNNRSQGYSLTNGSTSRDHSNASSPNHDPDTKPLLVVTAVTEAGRSPSVSQSSSLQFIDEEPRKKTERAPPQGQEQGDEYRPLLGSETSANSLLVSPTSPTGNGFSNGQVNNGRLLGTRPPANLAAADIGVETYFQRVSDSPSPKNGRAGILETTFADSSRQHPQQQRQSPPEKNGKSAKLIPKKSNGVVEIPDKRNGGVEIPIKSNGVVEIPVKSNGVVEIPTKSNGVVEIPHNGVVEIPLIRFCGLTQSDTSLSSMDGNRNYNYGNQSEYTPPYLGYLAGAEYINGLNSPYALALLTNPNGVFRNTQNAQNSVPKDRPYAAPCFGDSRNNKGQVYRCQNGAESQQNVTYTLNGSSFLAILPDPVVCFADARFRQTQFFVQGFSVVREITNTLTDVLGGNPYRNKY